MFDKIRRKLKHDDYDFIAFRITCPEKEEALWLLQPMHVGANGLPKVDFCKEICELGEFGCELKANIVRI